MGNGTWRGEQNGSGQMVKGKGTKMGNLHREGRAKIGSKLRGKKKQTGDRRGRGEVSLVKCLTKLGRQNGKEEGCFTGEQKWGMIQRGAYKKLGQN